MRLVVSFVNIVLALLMGLFAFSALKLHFGGNEDKYNQTLLLKTDGIEVVFDASSGFKDASNADTEDARFSLTYTFDVDAVPYRGICYVEDTLTMDRKNLSGYYLPDNPVINAVDVDKQLLEIEAQIDGKKDLKWGSVSLILSALLMFLAIRSIKMHKKKSKK